VDEAQVGALCQTVGQLIADAERLLAAG